MNLDSMSFFKLASQKMEWLAARQKVVSENIANANTPQYRAKDVQSFESYVASYKDDGSRDWSDPVDLLTAAPTVESSATDETWDQSIDGNNVEIEQQSVIAADTADQYRLAARLYKKGYEMLSMAASSQ